MVFIPFFTCSKAACTCCGEEEESLPAGLSCSVRFRQVLVYKPTFVSVAQQPFPGLICPLLKVCIFCSRTK